MHPNHRPTCSSLALVAAVVASGWLLDCLPAAAEVSLPASSAYHRHNYDPFEQAIARRFETPVPPAAPQPAFTAQPAAVATRPAGGQPSPTPRASLTAAKPFTTTTAAESAFVAPAVAAPSQAATSPVAPPQAVMPAAAAVSKTPRVTKSPVVPLPTVATPLPSVAAPSVHAALRPATVSQPATGQPVEPGVAVPSYLASAAVARISAPPRVGSVQHAHAPVAAAGQLSTEILLSGPDAFQQAWPTGEPMITPTAFQGAAGVPATEPAVIRKSVVRETLPAPTNQPPQSVAPSEPGADWSPKPLDELSTNIAQPTGTMPYDYWAARPPQRFAYFDPDGASRGWPVSNFNWVASCLCHNPLYFEEVNLERYGYGCGCFGPCCSTCVQSAVSAAHFFGTVPALPYLMGADCPMECDYTLGYYRPGSCPPWYYNCCSRCSALGGLSAGGVAVGLIFLIP